MEKPMRAYGGHTTEQSNVRLVLWFQDGGSLAAVSLAEGVGFEPTREREPPAGFQDRCLKPLGHPSMSAASSTYA